MVTAGTRSPWRKAAACGAFALGCSPSTEMTMKRMILAGLVLGILAACALTSTASAFHFGPYLSLRIPATEPETIPLTPELLHDGLGPPFPWDLLPR